MPTMTKRVNIKTTIPVRNIVPPIHGIYNNIIMSTGDILKCLCKRAFVEEILPDGSTVRLNMKNYYTDNGAGLDAYKVKTVEEDVKNEEPTIISDSVANVVKEEDLVIEETSETEAEDDSTPVDEPVEVANASDNEDITITVSDDGINISDRDSIEFVPCDINVTSDASDNIAVEDGASTDTAPVEEAAVVEETKTTKTSNGTSKKKSSNGKKKSNTEA